MSVLLSLLLAAGGTEIAQVYPIGADTIAIEIQTGQVIHGNQVPYAAKPGDILTEKDNGTWVERQGQEIGNLIEGTLLYTFDQLIGLPLDLDWASHPESFSLSSSTDQDYQVALSPSDVFRKTKPTDMALKADGQVGWPLKHTLYLQLPTPLEPGQTYQLTFNDTAFSSIQFEYQPQQIQSEAVHVSQVGFRPDDPLKVGYLSTWMGDGGGYDYPDGLTFWVQDKATGQIVQTGQARQRRPIDQSEDPRGRDYTLTEVHELDFSGLTRPGVYQLCVDTVGCSLSFAIQDTVWQQAFALAARGFYHQRSGIAVGAPHTEYKRPRAFHPGDGIQVYQSQATLMETDMGLGHQDAFTALRQTKTDTLVPNAWGGYFDAGDWDRRIQHLGVARSLLELVDLFPDYFTTVALNIPESRNTVPDLLDEALWGLDFFQRLQTPDGGIRGGIESASHPRRGETSWQDSLTVMAYAPDMWSSYIYAGVAARAAHVLGPHDAARANRYRDSALRAMNFAEQAYHAAQASGKDLHHAVNDERNLAALELFRLTGDGGWHALFLETTIFQEATTEIYVYGQHDQREAAFLYSRISDARVNNQVQQNALNAQLKEADSLGDVTQNTGFGWGKTHPWESLAWGNSIGAPKAVSMIRAHVLTGNDRYLKDILRASQFSLGANPDNMTFTTGLGHRSPENPLVIDQRILGTAPPPGITVYGPLDWVEHSDYWTGTLLNQATYPALWDWPTVESYFDIYLFPAATEFTVMQTMTAPTYTWGYLAARQANKIENRTISTIPIPSQK